MTFTYNRDIPDGPHNPSNDQPLMKTNTNSIDNLINIDHVSFNKTNAGYHTIIHQVDQSSPPGAIAGIHQLFSMIPPSGIPNNINDQLFAQNNGVGGLSQLTGSFLSANNGGVWCSGILLQWGVILKTISSAGDSGTVTFATLNKTFPLNCYTVITTGISSGTAPNSAMSVSVQKNSISKLSFDWYAFTGSADYRGFYWFAIGN